MNHQRRWRETEAFEPSFYQVVPPENSYRLNSLEFFMFAFDVTEHPTSQWRTTQQIVEAFPWDTAPRCLLRERDRVYGTDFRKRVCSLDIEEILTAPRSPWQNPYVERIIGSIRRECLDSVIVLNERHLKLPGADIDYLL
jgi:transposase InsO family protein